MNFSNDPTLNYPSSDSIQMGNEELARRIAELQQRNTNINMQAQVSPTPLWDEIDKIEDSLSSVQKEHLMQNAEYVDSLQYVTKLVQDEELRIIRPRIESSKMGQEALQRHLTLMRRLKKEVAQAEEQRSAMLDDYMRNHSDLTWNEYVAMKRKGGRS